MKWPGHGTTAVVAALLSVTLGSACSHSTPGQAPVATRAEAAVATTPVPAAPTAKATKSELVDLNSASKAELVKLPGVGEAIAGRIIEGRPWKSKYDLVVKKIVTRSVYDKFARLVVARQRAGN